MSIKKLTDKDLEELAEKAPQLRYGHYGENPALPYEGKAIALPRNLLEGANYTVGLGPTLVNERIGNRLDHISRMLNNITEILTFQILNLTPSQERTSVALHENLNKEIEKLHSKIIVQLEQNRQNINSEIQEIKNLENQRYETFVERQNISINIANEQREKILNLQEDIKNLKTYLEKYEDSLEEIKQKLISTEEIKKDLKDIKDKLKDLDLEKTTDKIEEKLNKISEEIKDKLKELI